MSLLLQPPIKPMLASRATRVPRGDGILYEPKWDGFRMLVFRDADHVYLQSRDLKPMARYFPELIEPLRAQLPARCVLDGEVVIARDGALDFEALLQRIHPAKSRVDLLAQQTPAWFVAFDLLCLGDRDLCAAPFHERRQLLEEHFGQLRPPLRLTPATRDHAVAVDWFNRFEGAGFDGVIAKPGDQPYAPGERTMTKVKHVRTIDCVVAGFRWHKGGEGTRVGSLLLGLFDDQGRLQHVGVAASFKMAHREALVDELAPWRLDDVTSHPWAEWMSDGDSQRVPGGPSRWTQGKDLSWVPLRPERVCEVKFDHLQGSRFRHTAHFQRWRPDKPPGECTYDQVDTTPPVEIAALFRPDQSP